MGARAADDTEKRLSALGSDGFALNFRCVLVLAPPPVKELRALLTDLQKRPQDARLRAREGRVLSLLGRQAEAVATLRRALKTEDARTRGWLAEAYLLQARPQDCVRAAGKGTGWTAFHRAAALTALGRTADAVKALGLLARAIDPELRAAGAALSALLAARAGKRERALSLIAAVVAAKPREAWPYALRSRVKALCGDRDGALADLDEALARGPAAWLHLERADLRQNIGKAAEALADLDAALAMGARGAGLKRRRALLAREARLPRGTGPGAAQPPESEASSRRAAGVRLMHQGRLAEAGRALDEALALSPRAAETLEAVGRLARLEGRSEQALAAHRQAVTLDSRSTRSYLSLVETLLYLDKPEEARAALAQARRDCPAPAPDDAAALCERYRLEAMSLDLAAAARTAEAVLALSRDYARLKDLRFPFDQYDLPSLPPAYAEKGLAAAARLIAEQPRRPWGYLFRRLLSKLARRIDTVEADLAALSRLSRGRYAFLGYVVGRDLLCDGRFAEAERRFAAAARSAVPVDWPSQCFVGETRLCRGDLKGALAAFRPLRGLPRDDAASVLAWKGALLLWAGRYGEALKCLDRALAGGALWAQGWRGAALLKLGRRAEAQKALDAALALGPNDLETRLWRAEALHLRGRRREALEQLEAAEALNAHDRNPYFHALRGVLRGAAGDDLGLAADYEQARLMMEKRRPLPKHEDAGARARELSALLARSRGLRRGSYELAIL